MFPIKMIYQQREDDKPQEMLVYAFEHSHDMEGNVVSTFCTAWNPKQKQWLVAPLWEFKPIENKVLTEEVK